MGAASVSEYVASLNEEQRQHVSAFIDFMRAEYPQLIPKISFSMPMWLLGKKMYEGYVAVSAAKSHFSIHFSFIVMGNQTVDQPGNCRFSTAAFAAKYDALTVLYGQIYIMDSTSVLVFFSIRESHMVNPYHRFTPSRQKEICC